MADSTTEHMGRASAVFKGIATTHVLQNFSNNYFVNYELITLLQFTLSYISLVINYSKTQSSKEKQ